MNCLRNVHPSPNVSANCVRGDACRIERRSRWCQTRDGSVRAKLLPGERQIFRRTTRHPAPFAAPGDPGVRVRYRWRSTGSIEKDIGAELPVMDHERCLLTASFAFRWCLLSESCYASREVPFKPASAERRELGPCSSLTGGPAAAQAPPRLRIEAADVYARGLRTL